MAWVWLTLAGLLEVVYATGIKYTDAFTRLLKIFYREAGPASAPVLLLLHGFPTSSRFLP